MPPDLLLNTVITIMATISVLVLISLGLALVYGMMGVINLAHGEFLMLGAFGTLVAFRVGAPLWLAMIIGAISVALIGYIVEMLLIRHLYGRLEATMLATWGLSLILVQTIVLIFGPTTTGVPSFSGAIRFGDYSVSVYTLFLIVIAIVALVAVYLIYRFSNYGMKARAVAENPEMAAALGVNSGNLNRMTFTLGAGLAGMGGALLAPMVGVVATMGQAYIGRAFMTVVVGGAEAVLGTALAASLLGALESIISIVSQPFLGTVALFIAAIVIVRLRPRGLTGGRKRA